MSLMCDRCLCWSPIVCTRSSVSSAVVQESGAASPWVETMRGECGLALVLSTFNICWSPSAMLQVSAGARHMCDLRLCQQIQRQANITHVINQAINPINLLYAFYFEARFPLNEASYSV